MSMELRDRCFLALLRDGLYGVCSQESRELAANMDRVLQDQVLELARLHNFFFQSSNYFITFI